MRSMRDSQHSNGRFPDVAPTDVGFGGLLWGSAGITVPCELLRQYADTALIREHYPAMKRYIDYIFNETIDKTSGIIVQNREWGDLADWLSPEYEQSDKSLLWECYLIYDLDIMSRFAAILGRDDEASRYAALAGTRRNFFNKVYVDPVTRKTRFSAFDPGKCGKEVDTQVSYALPIAMGIISPDDKRFVDNFIATIVRPNRADDGRTYPPYSLMTGFIGTAWIQEALSIIGRPDLAYRMLCTREYPSWLYPVTQGATTVWERLNSYTHTDGFGSNNSMNSFNHYSFGSVGNWLLTRALGIRYSHDGELIIGPQPDIDGSLTYARGGWLTPAGPVKSAWNILNGGKLVRYEIDLPATARFIAPDGSSRILKPGHHCFTLPVR